MLFDLNDGTTETVYTQGGFSAFTPGFGGAYINNNRQIIWQGNYSIFYAYPCNDADEDGYYVEGGTCGLADCDDSNPEVNPDAAEICNGIDDNCDGQVDPYPCTANAEAATYGSCSVTGSGVSNELILVVIPLGAVILLKILKRKK